MSKKDLTVEHVAERYGVSAKVIYQEVRAGRLPHLHIGPKLFRFAEEDLNTWEREQRQR